MAKIYTKTGDGGCSRIIEGYEQSKSSLIFDCLGDLDELNSILGECRKLPQISISDAANIKMLQSDIMRICSVLGGYDADFNKTTEYLEKIIDEITDTLPKLTYFILPDNKLHTARAICRRAERKVVGYYDSHPVIFHTETKRNILAYINRISDLLFTFARVYGENEKFSF